MTARGKREARRPWLRSTLGRRGLKGRNSITPFQGSYASRILIQGRRPDKVGTCPWLSYHAPLALRRIMGVWRYNVSWAFGATTYHAPLALQRIARVWRATYHAPLAL